MGGCTQASVIACGSSPRPEARVDRDRYGYPDRTIREDHVREELHRSARFIPEFVGAGESSVTSRTVIATAHGY